MVGLVFAPIFINEIKKSPKARGLLQVAVLLGGLGYFLLGHQTIYVFILVNVFFQTLAGSAIMPISDLMAVEVSEETGTGYGGIRVFASVGWIVAVLSAGWLIERHDFIAGFISSTAFSLYTVSYIGLISSRTNERETGTVLALYTITLASVVDKTIDCIGK